MAHLLVENIKYWKTSFALFVIFKYWWDSVTKIKLFVESPFLQFCVKSKSFYWKIYLPIYLSKLSSKAINGMKEREIQISISFWYNFGFLKNEHYWNSSNPFTTRISGGFFIKDLPSSRPKSMLLQFCSVPWWSIAKIEWLFITKHCLFTSVVLLYVKSGSILEISIKGCHNIRVPTTVPDN